MTTAQLAKNLAENGYAVFPVRADKSSTYTENGLKDATLDSFYAEDWFEKTRATHIGVHTGRSGLVVLDIDRKVDENGDVLVDGYDSLDREWLELPESFSYTSLGGLGRHILYAAPEGANFNGTGRYRGMLGVDRRAGESYIVYNSEEVPSRASLAPAPEWLCDQSTLRTVDQFQGSVAEWYETLEPGEPSVVVRAAMERTRKVFEEQGNDFDHAAVTERQFEAIRLGSEGHPGVPELLALTEELFFSRTGTHSRTEDEWLHEWLEALSSGVKKYGAATELRRSLPEYSPSLVPATVPENLFTGEPGDKSVFSALLRALVGATPEDLVVTAVLWGSPRTKDIAREWGLEFVHKRVQDARNTPEPTRENPARVVEEPRGTTEEPQKRVFLTDAEVNTVLSRETFIDKYVSASEEKGFVNKDYAVPAAWTALSMAAGRKAFIPMGKVLEVNTWFLVLGGSTTGKSSEDQYLRNVLDTLMYSDNPENYSLGAASSPDGLHLSLVLRDGLPSIVHNDEAADFFRDVKVKEWMSPVPDKLSKWFDSYVEPSNKISLKEARGKSAHTSLNMYMLGTPNRTLENIDLSMFESGFLARVNWVWGAPSSDPERKYAVSLQEGRDFDVPPSVYDIAYDLADMRYGIGERVAIRATPQAQKRLQKAYRDMDKRAKKHPRYERIYMSVDRLGMETVWKCAALLALYEGRDTFDLEDALTAIYYAEDWLLTMLKVAENLSESPYSRDLDEIEAFIRNSDGGVASRAALLYHFRGKVLRTQRELDDRIGYLVESGRVNVDRKDGTKYAIN